MNFPDFKPVRWIERPVWKRTFLTPRRSLSFSFPTIGVKALMAALNSLVMSIDEVIVVWGWEGWGRIING